MSYHALSFEFITDCGSKNFSICTKSHKTAWYAIKLQG